MYQSGGNDGPALNYIIPGSEYEDGGEWSVVSTTPVSLAISPDGKYLYAATWADWPSPGGTGAMVAYDTASFNIANVILMGANSPTTIAVTPDGDYIYGLEGSSLYVISTASNQVIKTVGLGNEPTAIATTPDGKYLYVTNIGSNTVSVVDTGTWSVVNTIPVGIEPGGIVISPDGNYVYVANEDAPDYYYTISVISASTGQVVNTIALANTVVTYPIAPSPQTLAITPDGKTLYIPDHQRNNVYVVNTSLDIVTNTILPPVSWYKPVSVFVTPDSNYAYIVSWGVAPVEIVSTANQQIVKTLNTNPYPAGMSTGLHAGPIAITYDGRYLFISDVSDYGSDPGNPANQMSAPIIDATTQQITGWTGEYSWIVTTT